MNSLPHLIHADGVWRRLDWPAATRGHFLLGSIAPDTHRVVPALHYRRLHFRSRRRGGERLRDFLRDYLEPALVEGSGAERAFWLGWLCHVIADALWQRLIRTELPELWSGCLSSDREERQRLREDYHNACNVVDRELAEIRPQYAAELRWLLRSASPEYDLALLNRASLSQWVGLVTTGAMPPQDAGDSGNEVISYAFVSRAIGAADEEALALITSELRRTELLDEATDTLHGL